MDARLPIATGPTLIAQLWIEAILKDRDLRRAWVYAHPELRLRLAKDWLEHEGLDPEAAGGLSELESSHELWGRFEKELIDAFRWKWEHLDFDTWGIAENTEPIGPNRELLRFVDMSDPSLARRGDRFEVVEEAEIRAHTLEMALLQDAEKSGAGIWFGEIENRWRVIGFHRSKDENWWEQSGAESD